MAPQHVFDDGDEWGMSVAAQLAAAVAEGRPLFLDWNEAGTAWSWPAGHDPLADTIEMPPVTDQLLAAADAADASNTAALSFEAGDQGEDETEPIVGGEHDWRFQERAT